MKMDAKKIEYLLHSCNIDDITIKKFLEFHLQNPEVWSEFESLALMLVSKGVTRWGAKNLMEVIRYNKGIQKRGEYKINNSLTAYYARLFMGKHRGRKFAEDLFELRNIKGLGK
jgi:hypothetical protein